MVLHDNPSRSCSPRDNISTVPRTCLVSANIRKTTLSGWRRDCRIWPRKLVHAAKNVPQLFANTGNGEPVVIVIAKARGYREVFLGDSDRDWRDWCTGCSYAGRKSKRSWLLRLYTVSWRFRRPDSFNHLRDSSVSAFQFGQFPVNPFSGSRPTTMLSCQRGSNKALNLCRYERGVLRAPCQKRKISTVRRDSAMR